jgi:hypothetical protein
MQLDTESLKKLCRKKRIRLNDMLEEAKVSRTAYYAMTRKESVLPKSVCRIARALGVSPLRFLQDTSKDVNRVRELQEETDDICRKYPECERDVVFRTLKNLDLPPVERLRKALIRGRKRRT